MPKEVESHQKFRGLVFCGAESCACVVDARVMCKGCEREDVDRVCEVCACARA